MRTVVSALAVLLVVISQAYGEPPRLEIPAEVLATRDYVTVVPRTDAKSVTYVALSGVEPLPSEMLRDPTSFVLPARGLPQGRYSFAAIGTLNDEQTRTDFTVVVGKPVVVVPGPVVPLPNPPQPPRPEPGPRGATVLHRASKQTQATARLIGQLREGALEDKLNAAGHFVYFLDLDERDSVTGQPTRQVQDWVAVLGDIKPPAIVVYDLRTRLPLVKQAFDTTKSDPAIVLDAIRASGGELP